MHEWGGGGGMEGPWKVNYVVLYTFFSPTLFSITNHICCQLSITLGPISLCTAGLLLRLEIGDLRYKMAWQKVLPFLTDSETDCYFY